MAGSTVDCLWIYILFGKYWVNDALGYPTCLSVGKVSHAGPKPGGSQRGPALLCLVSPQLGQLIFFSCSTKFLLSSCEVCCTFWVGLVEASPASSVVHLAPMEPGSFSWSSTSTFYLLGVAWN